MKKNRNKYELPIELNCTECGHKSLVKLSIEGQILLSPMESKMVAVCKIGKDYV